jgi:hypothetical protein
MRSGRAIADAARLNGALSGSVAQMLKSTARPS